MLWGRRALSFPSFKMRNIVYHASIPAPGKGGVVTKVWCHSKHVALGVSREYFEQRHVVPSIRPPSKKIHYQ